MWVLLLRTQVSILGELMENVRGSEDRLTPSLSARQLEGAVHFCLCRYHLRMCESVKRKHVANRYLISRSPLPKIECGEGEGVSSASRWMLPGCMPYSLPKTLS